MKGHHFDYKKILNGKFNYYSSELRNKLGFEGFIKLSKDPSGVTVNDTNIANRG